MPDTFPQLMSIKEAASLLAVSEKLLYRLFRNGELPGFRIAGAVRLDRSGLLAYLQARSNARPELPAHHADEKQQEPINPPARRKAKRAAGFLYVPR